MLAQTRNAVAMLASLLPWGIAPAFSAPPSAPSLSFDEPVTFSDALALALERDPRLDAVRERANAADGKIEQADLRPNPSVEAELENFLGTGPFEGLEGPEVTVGISQLIETAGKRKKRAALARLERDQLDWGRQRLALAIEATVRSAFGRVLIAQRRISLRQEQFDLARARLAETERLAEAAQAPELDFAKARLDLQRRSLGLARSKAALAKARAALAATWGVAPAPKFAVAEAVELGKDPPPLSHLAAALDEHPLLLEREAQLRAREAAVELEQARAKPDVEVFGGPRYFGEGDDEFAFIAGARVPWPLFDRNQGNVRSALAEMGAAGYEREVARRELLARLNAARLALAAARNEVLSIEDALLPAAEAALAAAEAGYERGRFSLTEAQDSQAAVLDARNERLAALERYLAARAELETLIRPARPLH